MGLIIYCFAEPSVKRRVSGVKSLCIAPNCQSELNISLIIQFCLRGRSKNHLSYEEISRKLGLFTITTVHKRTHL